MKKILLASALAFAAPASAWASDEGGFMHAGEIEAGGLLGIFSETETYKPDGGGDEIETTRTAIAVQPEVSYFIANGLALIGRLDVITTSESVDDEDAGTSTLIGLGAGAGYYIGVGGIRLGPQAILKFSQLQGTVPNFLGTTDDLEITQTGMGAEVGGFAKLSVGGGGVIAAGLVFDFENVTQEIEFGTAELEPEGTNTRIGARVGYFVTF